MAHLLSQNVFQYVSLYNEDMGGVVVRSSFLEGCRNVWCGCLNVSSNRISSRFLYILGLAVSSSLFIQSVFRGVVPSKLLYGKRAQAF